MAEKTLLEQQSTVQCVFLQIHQIEWPDVLNECVDIEILQWLLMESLSVSTLGAAAKSRIHVMRKPRTSKEVYWVIGGFISYLQLLATGWQEGIECVLDNNVDQKNLLGYFLDDLHLTLYPIKGGPVSAAGKATLLISLSKSANKNKHPLGVQAPYKMIINCNPELFKELVGFNSKAFSQSSKEGVPDSVLESIVNILKLNKKINLHAEKTAMPKFESSPN